MYCSIKKTKLRNLSLQILVNTTVTKKKLWKSGLYECPFFQIQQTLVSVICKMEGVLFYLIIREMNRKLNFHEMVKEADYTSFRGFPTFSCLAGYESKFWTVSPTTRLSRKMYLCLDSVSSWSLCYGMRKRSCFPISLWGGESMHKEEAWALGHLSCNLENMLGNGKKENFLL